MYFSDDREKYLGMAEAIAGVGLMIGPVIGSFLYSRLGYLGTFLTFSCILLIGCLCVSFALPNMLNESAKTS
jgi:MFS family permease